MAEAPCLIDPAILNFPFFVAEKADELRERYPWAYRDNDVLNPAKVDLAALDFKKAHADPWALYLITLAELMRGVDYRAPTAGLSVVVATPFEHDRQAQQGWGRAKRNKDPGERVRLRHVQLVHPVRSVQYSAKLLQFCVQYVYKAPKERRQAKGSATQQQLDSQRRERRAEAARRAAKHASA